MGVVRGSIMPEGYLSRYLTESDGYSFMRSNDDLGVYNSRQLSDQLQTSIRARYPRLKNRPEKVLFIVMLQVAFMLLPIALF